MTPGFSMGDAVYSWDPASLSFVRVDRLLKMPSGIIPVRRGVWDAGEKKKLTGFESKMYPAVKDMTPGPGGSYIAGAFSGNPQDVTGKTYNGGVISTSTGKNQFDTGDNEIAPATKSFGRQVRINLVKPVKWGWHEGGEEHQHVQHLISHHVDGKHYYSVNTQFADDHPVTLASYPKAASEPRLRPTTNGELHLGREIGKVQIKGGKINPVYDTIHVRKKGWTDPNSANATP
jgi:hypothetical protein